MRNMPIRCLFGGRVQVKAVEFRVRERLRHDQGGDAMATTGSDEDWALALAREAVYDRNMHSPWGAPSAQAGLRNLRRPAACCSPLPGEFLIRLCA